MLSKSEFERNEDTDGDQIDERQYRDDILQIIYILYKIFESTLVLGNERQGCNPANSGFYSESRDTKPISKAESTI